MSEFKFVPGEYKTRDGRRAVVRFRVQEPTNDIYPVVGEVMNINGDKWYRCTWTDNGENSIHGPCGGDLLPPVRYAYINCYANNVGGGYSSLKEADEATTNYRVGVLEVEVDLVGNYKWDVVRFISRRGCDYA